jgi:hypothetical protein
MYGEALTDHLADICERKGITAEEEIAKSRAHLAQLTSPESTYERVAYAIFQYGQHQPTEQFGHMAAQIDAIGRLEPVEDILLGVASANQRQAKACEAIAHLERKIKSF